jgi:hypothetical protein
VRRKTMIVPAAGALDGFPGEIEHADTAQHTCVPRGGIVCLRLRGVLSPR